MTRFGLNGEIIYIEDQMKTPAYTNKMERKSVLTHRGCKGIVTRQPGGRLKCGKCKQWVDAAACLHSEDK